MVALPDYGAILAIALGGVAIGTGDGIALGAGFSATKRPK